MKAMSPIRSEALGALAGVLGGLVLAAFFVAMSWKDGHDLWQPLKLAGYPLLAARALRPGLDNVAIAVGVALHLGISAAWGLSFGLVFHGLSRLGTFVAGLVWGFAAWAVMSWLVLPLADMIDVARAMPLGRAIFAHLLFGATLAVAFMPAQPARRYVAAPQGARPREDPHRA